MRIFKTKLFNKDAKKQGLTDELILAALEEVEDGLVDAVLGGGLFKKRVAKPGKGKSGGARTIIAFRKAYRTFFIYCYDHGEQDNIGSRQLKALKILAAGYHAKTEKEIEELIEQGLLFEIERIEDEGE